VADQFECEVWPDNWPAACVFLDSLTQWRYSHSGPMGLDYTALETVMRIQGVENMQAVFADVRVMEAAALAEIRNG
jgi:hypothetical protein